MPSSYTDDYEFDHSHKRKLINAQPKFAAPPRRRTGRFRGFAQYLTGRLVLPIIGALSISTGGSPS